MFLNGLTANNVCLGTSHLSTAGALPRSYLLHQSQAQFELCHTYSQSVSSKTSSETPVPHFWEKLLLLFGAKGSSQNLRSSIAPWRCKSRISSQVWAGRQRYSEGKLWDLRHRIIKISGQINSTKNTSVKTVATPRKFNFRFRFSDSWFKFPQGLRQ